MSIANRFLHNYDFKALPTKLKIWKDKQGILMETAVDKLKLIENWMLLVVEEFESNSRYFNTGLHFGGGIGSGNNFDGEDKLQQMLILKNDNKILNNEVKQLRKEVEYLNSQVKSNSLF